MSIYAYVGLPGSGKSYGVVANQVLPALKDGRTVVTNLPLRVELLREVIPGCDVRLFQTSEVAETPERIDEIFPPGCVAVIDEVWGLWPAGQKVDKIPQAFKSFLAEHRHRVDKKGRSLQIVLVCQDLAQIAAFARQLVEQTFVHKKLGALGLKGKYTVGVFEGNVTGLTPPESRRIVQNVGSYKKEVYRFYESHTKKEGDTDGADESSVDSRGNVWKRPAVWVGFAAALTGLVFGGTWVYKATQGTGSAASGGVATRRGAPAQSSVGVSRTSPQAMPAVWRVSGYIRDTEDSQGGVAFITDGQRHQYVPLRACVVERFKIRCGVAGGVVESGTAPRLSVSAEPIAGYDSALGRPLTLSSAP